MDVGRVSCSSEKVNFFGTAEVSKLAGVSRAALRRWRRVGLLEGDVRRSRIHFGLRALIDARAASALIQSGVPTRRLHLAADALRQRCPELTVPLATLQCDPQGRLVSRFERCCLDPRSGQLWLDLSLPENSKIFLKKQETLENIDDFQDATSLLASAFRAPISENPKAMLEVARRVLKFEPERFEAWALLGNAHFELGAFESAVSAYRKLVQLDPECADAWYNLGNALDECDLYEEATLSLKRCLAISPNHADAHFNLALILIRNGNFDLARPHLEEFAQLAPAHPDAEWVRQILASHARTVCAEKV